MRNQYDPWGRPARAASRQQSVPLHTALALRDQADKAMAELQRCREELQASSQQARSLRDALASSRSSLEEAKQSRDALRRALDEAEHRAELAEAMAQEALREAVPAAAVSQPPRDLDAAMEAAVTSLKADLANVRRHQQEAVDRAHSEGRAELLLPMVDTLDDLRRALVGAEGAVAEGLRAMDRRLVQRLTAAGATIVDARGAFDPALHEAIGAAPGPRDRIVQVVSHGLLGPQGVLRPARVLVGDGTERPSLRTSGGEA